MKKTSHALQLWLNLPAGARMVDSAYQDLLADRALHVDEAGANVRFSPVRWRVLQRQPRRRRRCSTWTCA
jgi:redox-sensitive bicupin YhaK (pirin superfamily)